MVVLLPCLKAASGAQIMITEKAPPCDVLEEMVKSGTVLLPDGSTRRLGANLSTAHSHSLYSTILEYRARNVIEIGMAYGVSTLSILAALQQTDGHLLSVDPYNGWNSGRKAALHAVERAGYAHRHRHIQAPSFAALPSLLGECGIVDLIYIDGAHDFDNVFIDSFYSDRLLRVGGVMGFNDTGLRDVWRVIRWLLRTGRYEEMDVGLKRSYTGRNPALTLARWLSRWPRQDRYFRKRKEAALT